MDERTRRIGVNEALLREVNERIEELETDARFVHREPQRLKLICECGDASCLEQISVAPVEYARVRRDGACFVVVPGHVAPDVEEVVEHRDTYDLIKKRAGGPAALADALDRRN